jgi:hypothetical protein
LQYGTTQAILEHFGLRDMTDLPAIEELRRMEARRQQQAATAPGPAAEVGTAPAPANPPATS